MRKHILNALGTIALAVFYLIISKLLFKGNEYVYLFSLIAWLHVTKKDR